MNDDELWASIDTQRLRTATLLEELSENELARPSLCEGWTVHEVGAHLTLQQLTLLDALRMALRNPGPLNRMINAASRREARLRTTEEIVAGIRAMVGSRRHNIGVTPLETLTDIVVHGQDIAIPLGRTLDVDPALAATAADRTWELHLTRKGRRMMKVFSPLPWAGHRLVATDTDWAVGEGPEIRGPILALLLLMTGRSVALPQLDGPGVRDLVERLQHT